MHWSLRNTSGLLVFADLLNLNIFYNNVKIAYVNIITHSDTMHIVILCVFMPGEAFTLIVANTNFSKYNLI